ncbi:phosphomannomutase/phosphoglucomutase [Paracoccaceae bacterium GXU_MW_L88]
MTRPRPEVSVKDWDAYTQPMINPYGFREYDARWRFPEEINLPGMTALGAGLGTLIQRRGLRPAIALGHDYRSYSQAVKNALALGLIQAGMEVHDIGLALSPMTYFSQFHLDLPAVAVVTASHNPNGWTGVKMGIDRPRTLGPDEMAELREIVMGGHAEMRGGGSYRRVDGVREAYLDDLANGVTLTRPLRVVCATGNGTASAFAPELLRRIGCEVIPLHTELDHDFPHYNPNPEAMEMLHDMAAAVTAHHADLALGFDGDGDRCGVVDNEGEEIFSDKIGVLLARRYAKPGAHFMADIKSTGLFTIDPVLSESGASFEYWKTGHSYIKARMAETGAVAGFEKSGHYFLAPPIGYGFDCGLRAAVEICKMLAESGERMADLRRSLPPAWTTPTLCPYCPDSEKYGLLERIMARLERFRADGGTLGGLAIRDVITVQGARIVLDNGSWALIRASSNTPNLVVVCESFTSEAELRAIFQDLDAFIRQEPGLGDYDQSF